MSPVPFGPQPRSSKPVAQCCHEDDEGRRCERWGTISPDAAFWLGFRRASEETLCDEHCEAVADSRREAETGVM